ncbi:MAG: UDP-N-acetylmuramoyl-tripeptide--D-alanyl-D-alanine ligase [Candidatus Magasanikbacteria bacterium]
MQHILEKILAFFAQRILVKYHPQVVGITGSVGKSGSKRVTTHILESKFRVRGSYGNYNNEIGLPLTVLGCMHPGRSPFGWMYVFIKSLKLLFVTDTIYPEILVLEMGADKPGDIQYLTSMVHPNIGVVTAVAPTHIEFFESLQMVIREKEKIVSCLLPNEVAILNRDEEDVYKMKENTQAKVISYGFHGEADIRATDIRFELDKNTGWPKGLAFKVIQNGNIIPVYLPGVVGEHLVYSVLSAIAVASTFGMNIVEMSEALQKITMMQGRMRIIPGIKGTLLIDDTYNASPKAMFRALEAFSQIYVPEGSSSYAVLGDMLELGSETEKSHKEIGEKIADHNIDYLVTVGQAMQYARESAKEQGISEDQIFQFHTSEDAGRFLQDKIKTGDVLLIKGSQGTRMEKIVKELMAEPQKASDLLVRQSEYWLKR